MIIRLEGGTAGNVEAARHSLEALARSWGQEITEAPADAAAAAAATDNDRKVIDPVPLASLVLSIPSAALAVSDLAGRIRKRRRAKELIGHAQHLATQQVTLCAISGDRAVELRTLAPDQLLDLLAGEDPAS